MNIFVIPSWYPSSTSLLPGVFVKEQTKLYAQHFPNDQLAISHWGQNDDRLLLRSTSFPDVPRKIIDGNFIRTSNNPLLNNCSEYFSPAFTWTRRIKSGNIDNIIKANLKNLLKFQRKVGSVNLIHAHVGYPGGYVAMKLAESMNIPYVVTEHMGPFPFESFKSVSGVEKCLIDPLKKASKVLSVSKHLQGVLKGHGVESEVFHNFIDDQFFQPGSSKHGHPVFSFLHVGRLSPEKDQKTLIMAAKQLGDIDFNIRLIGDGPLRTELQDLVAKNDLLGKVIFVGELDRASVLKEMQQAEALILSSSYENCPLSILEALACGKPVISTKSGGAEELLTSENGQLADVGDSDGLAKSMIGLVERSISYESENIRKKFLRAFGSGMAIEQLRNHYTSLIEYPD